MAMEELSKKSTLSGTFQMFYNAIDMLFFFPRFACGRGLSTRQALPCLDSGSTVWYKYTSYRYLYETLSQL